MARIVDIVGTLDDGSVPSAGTDALLVREQELVIAQGEDLIVKATVRNRSVALVNLTGVTGVLGVGEDPIDASQEGPAPVVLRAGVVQSPAANGQIWFTFAPIDTLKLNPAKKYSWDIWLTLADTTRQRIIALSPFTVIGSIVVPGAPTTLTSPTSIQGQSGLETFAAQTEKTVTIPFPYANTLYKVLVSGNDSVLLHYEKLSASQFKIKASAPFTGEASWRTEP